MMQGLVLVFGQIKMSSVNKVYTAVEKTWRSFGFHFAYYVCVCVCVLSGGVIREDSPYSIAAVPTSAARCPRCRRYTAESAECLCPRCQTVVSQAHWQAKVSPWQLANIALDGFVSLLLVKLHGTAESRPVPRLQPLRDVHLTPNQLSLHSGLLIFWTLRAEPAAQHVVMGE